MYQKKPLLRKIWWAKIRKRKLFSTNKLRHGPFYTMFLIIIYWICAHFLILYICIFWHFFMCQFREYDGFVMWYEILISHYIHTWTCAILPSLTVYIATGLHTNEPPSSCRGFLNEVVYPTHFLSNMSKGEERSASHDGQLYCGALHCQRPSLVGGDVHCRTGEDSCEKNREVVKDIG